MAKNKKKTSDGGESSETLLATASAPGPRQAAPKVKDAPPSQPSTSALIICRNKHWRYISSFHGPWLQLPPEVLESLANNNYNLPRPRPIDPAVFYDLLKIRRLVDEATNLSVRAASGVTSSSLTNSLNAGNGLLGNSGAAMGLGLGGGGGNAKLSRERKHRMREQATQKLSKAYHLDEIACSVATMQSASTLEDVAQFVLQRSPNDSDAKYVHFFHEKIPSRQMAECTSLQPLDEIIADRPSEGELLRTRAVTKMFKEDWVGAAQDLTAALHVCRFSQSQHKAGRQQLQLASAAVAENQRSGRWKEEIKLDEDDHPNSLETQLLFHRAGVYLTIACQYVSAALPPKTVRKTANGTNGVHITNGGTSKAERTEENVEKTTAEKETERERLEARKLVKTNAKRALRDYIAYLSHFDYTPGLPAEITEEFVSKVNQAANGFKIPRSQHKDRDFEIESDFSLRNGQVSDSLVPHAHRSRSKPQNNNIRNTDLPSLPTPVVHRMSTLFSATPPVDLPPYPETAVMAKKSTPSAVSQAAQALLAQADVHEALTYHPLLTDALHSLLLCHTLIQTSPTELTRHVYMVARLARVCDGYPVFQAARSPARADWIEILRRAGSDGGNKDSDEEISKFISLSASWEILCAPAPLPGQSDAVKKESSAEKQERLKQQAIIEALEDDRVHDEASFHAAVAARQQRQEEESRKAEGREMPKRWAQEDGKEYPISTERAAGIVRWVKEAALGGEGSGSSRKKKKGSKSVNKGKVKEKESIVESIEGLQVVYGEVDTVEEEVD